MLCLRAKNVNTFRFKSAQFFTFYIKNGNRYKTERKDNLESTIYDELICQFTREIKGVIHRVSFKSSAIASPDRF